MVPARIVRAGAELVAQADHFLNVLRFGDEGVAECPACNV
jgi:hypothetical protein